VNITALIASFAHDAQLKLVVVLIVADFIFGVGAALKLKTFNASYVATFARDDLLGKVVPWFALFAFGKVANGVALGPVGFGALADSTFVLVTGALVASVFSSLKELGVPVPLPVGPTATPRPPSPPAV
jgi:hypothetical protein